MGKYPRLFALLSSTLIFFYNGISATALIKYLRFLVFRCGKGGGKTRRSNAWQLLRLHFKYANTTRGGHGKMSKEDKKQASIVENSQQLQFPQVFSLSLIVLVLYIYIHAMPTQQKSCYGYPIHTHTYISYYRSLSIFKQYFSDVLVSCEGILKKQRKVCKIANYRKKKFVKIL